MFIRDDINNLWADLLSWCWHHVNIFIGWAMVAVSVALEPVAQNHDECLFTIQQVALANEYATFIARLLQIVTVAVGLYFMIKGRKKDGKG